MPTNWEVTVGLLRVFCAPLLVLASSHAAFASSESCSTALEDKEKVVETMRQFFASTSAADATAMQRVLASDFYAFDMGKRVDTAALVQFAKAAIDAGKHYSWTVNEPDVHLTCKGAWIAYTNRGVVQEPSGTTNRVWLESAVLVKEAGTWKVEFFQSTRVP